MTFSWKNGRQLAALTKNNKTTSYIYDISGVRTQKSIDGTVTKYYYNDSNNLVSMTVGDKTLMFYYDQNGSVSSVLYNGVMYYYIKNLQGDIMRIVDENGNSIAIYAYDQWGKPTQMRKPTTTTVDLVNYNPFLYRGYVYDSDSGLYYLQSRYYDPVTGRFLNADIYCDTGASVLGTNMFAYCENNNVSRIDITGNSWATIIQGIVVSAAYTMRLSIMMYAYAATGARLNNNISLSDWWNPIGQALKSRLKSSKTITDRVKSYIKKQLQEIRVIPKRKVLDLVILRKQLQI